MATQHSSGCCPSEIKDESQKMATGCGHDHGETDFRREWIALGLAIAESQSNHPIARSIVEVYSGEIAVSDIQNYEELSGQGIRALIQGKEILVGQRMAAASS